MVRQTLGEDAIIVATGEERGGKTVRVVAAIEPAFEIGRGGIGGSEDWLQYDREQDADAIAEELTDVLFRHAVPEDVIDKIISCTMVMGFEHAGIALVAAIEQFFTFQPLPTNAQTKPIMLVGAPGAGKTLAVAKLAARSAMNGLNVGVVSTDTVRAGGVEQLQAFTNLLNIDLKKAKNAADLSEITNDLMAEADQIIIDTPGINPFNTDDVKSLAKLISVINARPVFVVPAGIDSEEAGEMARVFSLLGVTQVLSTRVDIARRLGSLLAAAHQGKMCFSDMSNTAKVAQGLTPMSSRTLARILMPGAYADQIDDERKSTKFATGGHAQTNIQTQTRIKTGTRQ